MDASAFSPPSHILGYTIHSRTRIYVSYLIPSALELAVYIAQIVADCAVSYQHFHTHQPDFGWATLSLILVPPVLTFLFVLSSQDQWANPKHANRLQFVGYHLLQMLLFPFFAMYRFMVRVFWSAEALFQDDDDAERMRCLAKATQCSTCELYHLIQAYGQSAPQIILQLYHMLTQDLFRNFQTTNVQALSLVFSAIDLAVITTTYQRFESQRQVGRHYPWSPPQEVEAQRCLLEQNKRLRYECEQKKRESERTINTFPETEKIMSNFHRNGESNQSAFSAPKTHTVQVHGFDEVDNDTMETTSETTVLLHDKPASGTHNATDDDKIRISPKLSPLNMREQLHNVDEIQFLDTVPDSPAPSPPAISSDLAVDAPQLRTQTSTNSDAARNKRASNALSQLETFKDMLIVNAQLYIKEHVPRPPKMLIRSLDEQDQEQLIPSMSPVPPGSPSPSSPSAKSTDVTDFFLPRTTKVINGIQQDDFAAKTIAFFGWISFIIMRMLSLSTFCVFFPKDFLIILGVHYLVMLVALGLESRFRGTFNRTLSYLLLAYVYIFVLLEFRIKFKHIRVWLIGYFLLTMFENILMTMLWYAREEFESWWFGFIFEGIIYSGILLMATLLVYYYFLKPKNVALIVEDTDDDSNVNTNE